MRKNPYVWGCLDGVWRCLGGVLECLDGVWMVFLNSVLNNSGVVGRVVFEIALLSKSPTIRDVLRCLQGVCGVSVGYLDGVWGSLDIVWEVETQNQLKTIQ